MCINRKNEKLPKKDVKDAINNMELKSRDDKKDGLILLVGNMLSLGITIEMCDVVFLMNSTLSSDKVLQQMYRCMTEGANKNLGIVVDLNISRVLNTFMNYTIYKNELSPEEKVKYLIDNHLINIDVDLMETKKINSDVIVKDLMDIWKSDPINSIKSLLRNLINDYENYENHIQKKLNSIFTKSLNGETNIPAKLQLISDDEDIQDEIQSGKEKKKIIEDDNSDIEEKKKKKEEEIIISFTKDVLPYIIPLTCILTIKNSNTDFVKMLNDIKDNKELLEIFDDQCFIWWNKKDLIDFIMNSDFSSRLPLTEASYNTSFAERNNINSHLQLLNYLNDQLVSRQNLQSNLSRRVGYADLTTLEQNRYKEAKLDLKRIFTRYNIPSSNYLDISYNLTKADLATSPYILNPNEFLNCFIVSITSFSG
jgi:phospholipid N-methyltransferase